MSLLGFVGKLSTTKDGYASGIDLGILDDVGPTKQGPLDTSMYYPGLDAKEQEAVDSQGAFLSITIQGEYIPSDKSWTSAIAWAENILRLITGDQWNSSQPRWLSIYKPDEYSPGVHLWFLRDDLTQAMNSSANRGIHVIVESFDFHLVGGDEAGFKYNLKCNQQTQYTT